MTKSIQLGKLAAVRTALTFRDKAPEDAPDGNARVFSIKDLVSGWPTDFDKLPRVQVDESKMTDAVASGDILMPGRGLAYPARLFYGSELPLFPAGQVHIVRAKIDVNAGFLYWYLNRREVQEKIAQMLTGSTIKALNKSQLQSVIVDLPSLATQNKIAHLQSLVDRRTVLRTRLAALEESEFEMACRVALTKEHDHE